MVSETPTQIGKSIIVAVGRSGTTILHRLLLEIYVDHYGNNFDCLYEPFVWDNAAIGHYPRDTDREAQFGRRDALSEEGLYLHTRTPLFSDNADTPPDLSRYLRGDTAGALLAKFIRANGRLKILDKLYPEGRFILMVRNPLDVVNSVLTKFSFFGPEFHRNDFPRFAADVRRLYGITLPAEEEIPAAYKAGLWCHFMNLHALRHAQDKPNYKVVVYEDFSINREAYARSVCTHVGAPYRDSYGDLLGKTVGRVTKGASALSASDVTSLEPLLEKYAEMIAGLPQITPFDIGTVRKKYASETLRTQQTEPRGLGWSPNKLESEIIRRDRALREIQMRSRARLAEVQRATLHAEASPLNLNTPISAVISNFNSGASLRRAVDSLRAQSRPVSEIIIVDNASSDGSRALIASLAEAEPRIRPILREQSGNFAAIRNDGADAARAPLLCFLDAVDEYDAGKIEREAHAIHGRDDAVAFSDTLLTAQNSYLDCSWIAGLHGRMAIAAIAARKAHLPLNPLISTTLFKSAARTEGTSTAHLDWASLISLAEKARYWIYSGGPGTLTYTDSTSQMDFSARIYTGLEVLCRDTFDILQRNQCNGAAFAGLLKLMQIHVDPDTLTKPEVEDLIGLKIGIAFAELRQSVLDKPLSAYKGHEKDLLDPVNRLMTTIGIALGGSRS